MAPKKTLVGLFLLLFFLSGIGLALLMADEQRDLSSRAAIGIPSMLSSALPGDTFIENGGTWDGSGFGLPIQIIFDTNLWNPPLDNDPVFLNTRTPVSLRLLSGEINQNKLAEILGINFSRLEPLGVVDSGLSRWRVQSFTAQFFNEQVTIDLWTNTDGISAVAVLSDIRFRDDIAAFISGIKPIAASVKGLITTEDYSRLAALIRPSVVLILNNYCSQIKFPENSPLLPGKVYPFCLSKLGTGFFVNKMGFIATNGHVVATPPEMALTLAVSTGSLDNLLIDYFQLSLSAQVTVPVERATIIQKVNDARKNKESTYQMAALIDSLYKKKSITLENSQNNFYVQLGNTALQLSEEGINVGREIVKASFIASDYQVPDPVSGFNSSDVGLIKVEGENYPALQLGNIDDVQIGSDLLVVGFPGFASGTQNQLLDISANAQPTLSPGIVSSFKLAKGNRKKLIQTDAQINHGNSGGPGVNSEGKVVGIGTYGALAEDGLGAFYFLRDIADLKALMAKNNITEDVGETYTAWMRGLENYWFGYFKYAKEDFDKVKSLYPLHPTVDEYLASAQSKIGSVEDKTPALTRTSRRLYMNITGGTMALSIIAIITLAISDFVDKKRQNHSVIIPSKPHIPSQTAQTF